MSDIRKQTQQDNDKRRDDVLRTMLKMKPKPKQAKAKKKPKKKPKK